MHDIDNQRDAEEEAEGGFGFQDLIAILHRRFKLIVSVIIVSLGLSVISSLLLANQYDGIATIQLEPRGKKIISIDSVIQDLKGDTPTIESEVEIVRSTAILSQVIDILHLRNDKEFNSPSTLQHLLRLVGLGDPSRDVITTPRTESDPNTGFNYLVDAAKPGATQPQKDEIILALRSRLKVHRVRNTLLINVTFQSVDPIKAARIANTIAEVYIRTQLAAKQRANKEVTGLLNLRVTSLRQSLTQAELKLERFKSANGIFDSEGHILLERRLAREMETLVQVQNETAKAHANYEQARRLMLQGRARESVADVLQSPTVRLLRDGLTKALRLQAELQTKYGPRHPEMEKITADVAKAQNTLTIEVNKIIRNLKTQYLVARQRQAQLEGRLQKLKTGIGSSKETQGAYRNLQREVSATKQLYQSLLIRMKQVAETTELQFADARIIQRAGVPTIPSAPKRKKIILLAFCGSLILAFGLAFLMEYAQPGFARPEDVERALDLPQIATFPEFANDITPASPLEPVRLMIAAPHSAFAESTRALRYEIDTRRPHDGSRLIMLTSALPNEGKSLVASNLAHYLALSGSRTLLIDGDLRRGKLSADLGVQRYPGLLDVLAGTHDPLGVILTDATTGLHVMPAMSRQSVDISAPELLMRPVLPATVQILKQHFDTIVIDVPPLLPIVDARIFAAYADQIAFVMTWRKTPKKIAKRALKLLSRNQSKVSGIIINRVDLSDLDAGMGYPFETVQKNDSSIETAA